MWWWDWLTGRDKLLKHIEYLQELILDERAEHYDTERKIWREADEHCRFRTAYLQRSHDHLLKHGGGSFCVSGASDGNRHDSCHEVSTR